MGGDHRAKGKQRSRAAKARPQEGDVLSTFLFGHPSCAILIGAFGIALVSGQRASLQFAIERLNRMDRRAVVVSQALRRDG